MISTYEFLATWMRARFADSERGASLVEYALLVALIAVVCIVAVRILGQKANSSFSSTGSAFHFSTDAVSEAASSALLIDSGGVNSPVPVIDTPTLEPGKTKLISGNLRTEPTATVTGVSSAGGSERDSE